MAEGPEVETFVRDLKAAVVGRTIQSTQVLLPAAVRFPDVEAFVAQFTNRTVLDARRWGKHILLPLSDDLLLEVHLMLWGTLSLVPSGQACVPETLVVWHLDNVEDLRLSDPLGYARVAAAPPDILAERLALHTLGPDVLDTDLDVGVVARQLGRRRGVLKSVLLNQQVLSGLGNRDTDESLWLAGIDPRRTAASLVPEEIERLHAAMKQVLAEGIAQRGTQRDLFGRKGQARHRRYIFERTGQPCPRCQTPVTRVRIGGRNTHFCPSCQH